MFAAECTLDGSHLLLGPDFSSEPGDFWVPFQTGIDQLPESSAEPFRDELDASDDAPANTGEMADAELNRGHDWLMELLARQTPEELGYIRSLEGDWWDVGSRIAALAGRLERNEPVSAEEIVSARRLVEGPVTGWALEPPVAHASLAVPAPF